MLNILVIGSGVSGLSTGVRLQEAGHHVTIWAKDLPPNTTSNVAGAVWHPFKAAPADKLAEWSAVSFQVFKQLLSVQESGVVWRSVLEFKAGPSDSPPWATSVDTFRHATKEELADTYGDGFFFEAPIIDTTRYLAYLIQQFQGKGGQIVQRAVANLSEAFDQTAIVIVCAGLGARELLGDRDLHPSRGQVVRIKPNGFTQALIHDDEPANMAYIFPRVSDIVLGGTDEEFEESTAIRLEDTQGILQRCAKLSPLFAHVGPKDIVSVACGLRPVRSVVRLEAERPAPDRLLLYNYGHGGAGVTLSWGCAQEVVRLLGHMLY